MMSEQKVPRSVEQRIVIKFLVGENVPSAEIHHRLQQQYGEDCIHMYFLLFCCILNWRHYSSPASHLLPAETVLYSTRLESRTSKLPFRFVSQTFQLTCLTDTCTLLHKLLICLHVCKPIAHNVDEFKESFVSNKSWHESGQEPDTDVIPHFATRCHYSAEPLATLFHLTVPQS